MVAKKRQRNAQSLRDGWCRARGCFANMRREGEGEGGGINFAVGSG